MDTTGKTKFKVFCPTKFGQTVFVCGCSPSLGSWDPKKALPLTFTKNFWWVSETVDLGNTDSLKYKYILQTETGEIQWEEMPNRIFQPLPLIVDAFSFQGAVVPQASFEVMSFNARYASPTDQFHWTDRKRTMIELILERNPDLIGFQELLPNQLDDLQKALSAYSHIGVGRDGGSDGEFSAIFYKKYRFSVLESGTFWLSDTPNCPGKGWNAACPRICTWAHFIDLQCPSNDGSLHMFNTHLDHISTEAKIKGMELILNRLESEKPTNALLTGDFNALPDSALIDLVSSKLTNSRTAAKKSVNAGLPTFTNFNPAGGDEQVVIDYIFFQGDIEASQAETITEYDARPVPASDHRPISAIFNYK